MAEAERGQTVLLVEDEPSIRALMRRMLRGLGYTMLEARTGKEALALAERHDAPLHLLVTDIVMPEMSGFDVANRLTLLHPEAKVLFLTGHAEDFDQVREGLKQTSHAFLLKPFTQQQLREKIEAVLKGQG